MKKVLATILTLIYFVASTGATVNIHYCMGKPQSMDLGHPLSKKEVCHKCGMTNKKGCCEEKQQVVKLEKKYTIPVTGVSATKITSLPTRYCAIEPSGIQLNDIVNYFSSNSPPGRGGIPIFIRNCVFLI